MPLHASAVGLPVGSLDIAHDARWLMAYSAGVPDARPELYDTGAALGPGVVAHPLFPVAPEWALIIAQHAEGTGLTGDETRRGIHIGHDLLLARPLVAGESVRLTASIVGVGRLRAGATQQTLFTATAADGSVVWRTLFTNLFLGVELVGEPVSPTLDWPAVPTLTASPLPEPLVARSTVGPLDAHVYSECARIWNPIHTDVVAARRAGLAAPILHGTATLARAVSLATELADVPIAAVRRITGSFRSPVALSSSFEVRLLGTDADHLWFDARLPDGTPAVADGTLTLVR